MMIALFLAAFLQVAVPQAGAVPYSDAEIERIIRGDEARIRAIRDQEVNQLRLALGRRLPHNRRADLYFRLAELYLEAYRQEFLLEGRAHEKRVEDGRAKGTIDRTRSRPYLKLGIGACEEILKSGLAFPRLDQVYYFVGVNASELGDRPRAQSAFQNIVRRFPQSAFAGEAYRELGESAYSKQKYREAVGYLREASFRIQGPNLPRVLHRLAWSYYRTKQYSQALSTMKSAIARLSTGDEKLVSLKEEALRDVAIFFTESGRVEEALAYFEQVAGDKEFYAKALEKLGKQYERTADPKRATQVYEAILKTRPEDDAAFRVLAKLVETDLNRGRTADAARRLKTAPKILKPGEDETGVIAQNLKARVRKTATESHEKYRKNKDRGALATAEEFYKIYLGRFLALDDARKEEPEVRMYLADVLKEQGRSKEAAEAYKSVIDAGDERYSKQAARLWTASLLDAMNRSGQKESRRSAPSPIEMEFVEAADALQKSLGEKPEGREAALRAAQVLAGYPETRKEGLKRAARLTTEAAQSPQGVTAARLWLQSVIDASKKGASDGGASPGEVQEVIETIEATTGLLAFDRSQGGKLAEQVRSAKTGLEVGEIARAEKDQKFGEAAKKYETLARSQSGEVAETAYANASGAYVRSGDFDSVARVAEEWLKRFPQSKRVADAIRDAATSALIQGAFSQSAALLAQLGRGGKDFAAIETAGRIYEGIGELGLARQCWEKAAKLYPSNKGRFLAALKLARSYEGDAASDSVRADFYRFCMASGSGYEAECGASLADLYFHLRDTDKARDLYAQVGRMKGTSPYIAYGRYRIAEMLEASRSFAPLKSSPQELQRGVQARVEFLGTLSQHYNSVVQAGGPWALAALNQLARYVDRFASELEKLDPPSGVSAEAFRKELGSVIVPLRVKSYEARRQAYDQAHRSEVLSPAIVEVGDRLAEGAPGKPRQPRAQGSRGGFRIAGIAANGGDQGEEKAFESVRARLMRDARQAGAWVDYGNLLWGQGKPGLAKLGYDRALSLESGNASALNNRAVVDLMTGDSEEDWVIANSSNEALRQALSRDDLFLVAKMNRASLLNYYRIFPTSRKLWEQIGVKVASVEAHDGLGVALTGLGSDSGARSAFDRGDAAGGSKSRFVRVYHDAARLEGRDCLKRADDLSDSKATGFEKQSLQGLKAYCGGSK